MKRQENTGRRGCIAFAIGLAALSVAAAPNDYPNKPIRMVVAFNSGSGNDVIAREVARHLGDLLGQSVVVENKSGGGGTLGTGAVAKAAPDGYTIGLGTSSQLVMNVAMFKALPFDVEKDLTVVGLISRTPLALVASPSSPSSLKALLTYARANPGRLTYGSAGAGSITHIAGEAFSRAAGITMLHVPYKGNSAALTDLSGGYVNLLFDGLTASVPAQQQGRAQILAISGNRRNEAAPKVPTFSELGMPEFQAYTWNSLIAPSATPHEIVARLNTALNKVLALPSVRERMAQSGAESLGPTSIAQAEAFAQKERAHWVPFVRSLRIDSN